MERQDKSRDSSINEARNRIMFSREMAERIDNQMNI